MGARAVLVGLPGTGKTTTGRRLAKVLVVPFADSDELVEAHTDRTVPELFATLGEPAFRALEAEAIAATLPGFDGVLAMGGGALQSAGTREVVAASGVPVVWLRAEMATLELRVGDGSSRPLLHGDVPDRLAALAAEREPVYASVATLVVDTGAGRPAQLAALIAARLHDLDIRRSPVPPC